MISKRKYEHMNIILCILISVARDAGMNAKQIEWAAKIAESKCT